ncbi:MAG: 3-deoxy-7-phosphoheptulonate synthase [Gammaproteobacteria bacterium]|jgi:3-deoxy-7-phosphoheptulonate synthase|nr:3-deoxy-7-phosphoheptulonate synthase [Gammaproteobacteria bacterium]MBT3721853.1 3-deoxy-7-phosphoheptulonate synthase [Gammaproteobacteria bacterium]MBT4194329.1 3-deoxy-7-phosphoheptulonate synthase [Gammaproteobacteria bacterium]MBT4451187.1 3-deoxy-7-phosphoheptulonate synthase [Gammaproteobacteria bacterium]MBT4859292.1 3-deoxy-7-phosphoheptulonate synthase [Gammaproteobacteria bacterium]
MSKIVQTNNLRIVRTRPLLTPALLTEEIPATEKAMELVNRSRSIVESILDGIDKRMLAIVGPCSVHDPAAAIDYAKKLKPVADQLSDSLFIMMRVYFEKPRTVMGWKGLINDPDMNGSYRINEGLRKARQLLADISEIGLSAGTEFLDTTFGQFYTDLISWGAIGARTVESQIHRELASGLSMPVGFKNRTDGNIQVAVDSIVAARNRHLFPSLTSEGAPAILETTGNNYGHLVLRGGSETGTNYDSTSIKKARQLLKQSELPEVIMVDCSHGNSLKDPVNQHKVVDSIIDMRSEGDLSVCALMLESNLVAGNQKLNNNPLKYGQSVTDACLDFDDTVDLLQKLAGSLSD